MTTVDDIQEWIKDGKKRFASYIIIVYNSFDDIDYPIYIYPGDDVEGIILAHERSLLHEVQEVINLSIYDKQGNLDI